MRNLGHIHHTEYCIISIFDFWLQLTTLHTWKCKHTVQESRTYQGPNKCHSGVIDSCRTSLFGNWCKLCTFQGTLYSVER